MRDNGLPAQQWAHVADLDPRVADAALEALREAGVAAYATPHAGEAGPYLDVQLPNRPTDRLYVDSNARERAVAVLAQLARTARGESPDPAPPGRSAAEVDATFDEIVSQFGVRTAPRDSGPSEETRDTSARVISGSSGWDDLFADMQPPPEDPASLVLDALDEGYVPPPPPPVPTGTPMRRFAWLGVLGAPLIAVAAVFTNYRLDGWAGLFVVGAFIGGLVTLVATLDDRRVDDDDPDHGAVV